MSTLIKRRDVALQDTWCLEDIFATDELVKEGMKEARRLLDGFKVYEGKLTSSAEVLYEALQKSDEASKLIEKIYVYSHMRLHQDGGNSFYQDLASQSEKLLVDFQTALSFVNPELSTLTEADVDKLIASYAPLSLYRRSLQEVLRQKEHILDAKMEDVLSQFREIATAPS
ncbi:MAG: oligoendopeptidase F, partial [Candidatus Niameybacter stercoravium]|nr:oligoendopeptidase F [Candidatus Niameybacter stercoravium]